MALRTLLTRTSILNSAIQNVRTSSSKLRTVVPTRSVGDQAKEEEMDKLQNNPYFDKYKDKIAKLQQTSPEEFMSRVAAMEEAASKVKGSGSSQVEEKSFSLPTQPKRDVSPSAVSQLSEKRLSTLMKVELLEGKSAEEIGDIWREYHAGKDAVAAVIPAKMWESMQQRFEEHKTFLLPLPRKEGYEFIVVQFQGKEAHFTTLINYQAYKENAPECLTIVHYTELVDSNGIVLMVGEFDKNFMTTQEAQCLANQVEMYYCNPSQEKRQLMDTFTHKPEQFKHSDLIAQVENISLLTAAPSTSDTQAESASKSESKN